MAVQNYTLRNCPFAFRCTKKWEELQVTEVQGQKFCDDCQQIVYLCMNDRELNEAILRNRCVAIPTHQVNIDCVNRNLSDDFEIGFPS